MRTILPDIGIEMANTVFASLESIVGKDWQKGRENATEFSVSSSSSSSSAGRSRAVKKSVLSGEENQHPNMLVQNMKKKVINSRLDLIPSGMPVNMY